MELPGTSAPAYMYALRIDPDAVTFRVHYDPAQPRSIEEWQAETGTLAVFNGGFFSGSNRPGYCTMPSLSPRSSFPDPRIMIRTRRPLIRERLSQ